ncbi:MAG: efflux RND transporter permease subunit [Dehalococcoidia bacterium]
MKFLIFEPGADLIGARQQVQERLQVVTPNLPTWAAPPFMLSPLSSTSRTMKIGLTSKKYSIIEMSMTTYWHIREHLLRVPGVANVAIWGEQLRVMQVQGRPGPDGAQQRQPERGDGRHGRSPRLRTAALRRLRQHGWHRQVRRTPNQRLAVGLAPYLHAGRSRPSRRRGTRRPAADPGRHRGGQGGPPAALGRLGDQRRPRADVDHRGSSPGGTRSMSPPGSSG